VLPALRLHPGLLPLSPPCPLPPAAAAAVAWYPPAVLEEVLAVEDWEGLRLHLARMAAGGTLRALVPFGALAPVRPLAALSAPDSHADPPPQHAAPASAAGQ
jgi:hypothetical protein